MYYIKNGNKYFITGRPAGKYLFPIPVFCGGDVKGDVHGERTGVSEGVSLPGDLESTDTTAHDTVLWASETTRNRVLKVLPQSPGPVQSPAQPLLFSFFFFTVLPLLLEGFRLTGGAPSFLPLAFFTFSLMASMFSLPSEGAAAGTEEAL